MSGLLHTPGTSPPETKPGSYWAERPHSQNGHFGEEKNLMSLAAYKPWTFKLMA